MSEVANDLGSPPAPLPTLTPPTASDAPGCDPRELETMRRYYGADWQPPAAAPGGTKDGAIARTGEQASDVLRLSPDEARAMAARMIKAGADPATVEAALRQELGDQPAAPEDSRSDEQREWDHQHGFDQEYAATDYNDLAGSYRDAGLIQQATPEAFQEWGSFLAAGAIPPGMGEGMVSQLLRDARVYGAMSEGQRTLWNAEQVSQAKISAGSTPEAFAERVRLRDVFVSHMLEQGQASIIDALDKSGAMKSAYAFATMANLGARLEQYRSNYPKDAR